MMFSLLSRNCFVWFFVAKVRFIFIKASNFVGPLGSNLKRAETKMVFIDECHKVL